MKRQLFLSFVTLVLITANSCSSVQIGKLEGRWQLFFTDKPTDPSIYVWEFASDNVFTITQFSPPTPADPNPTPSVICRGEYTTKAEFERASVTLGNIQPAPQGAAFLQLSMITYQDYNVDWEILKIDNQEMRMGSSEINYHNDGAGYVIREFTRID